MGSGDKRCSKCGQTKTVSEFYRDRHHATGTSQWCRRCKMAAAAQWRRNNPDKARAADARNRDEKNLVKADRARETRAWLKDMKIAAGCADCGYRGHPDALEFDHLPGRVKRFKISGSSTRSRATLAAEIAKCEVVCANCHRVRTSERMRAA